jgi:hypothetical protein
MYGLGFILDIRSTWTLGDNAPFSIQKVCLSTLILFCNLREHFSEQLATFVSYSNRQVVFNNKIVMRISALEILKIKVKSMTKLCLCFSRYMSLYISFTLMSIAKFPRTNHTVIESMFESLKPTLNICYTNWIKFYIICSSSAELFVQLFAGLPVSSTVEGSRSI